MTPAAIRRRADLPARRDRCEAARADDARYLRYWWSLEGDTLALEGLLPAADGAVVARALDRLAARLPDVVDDDCPGQGCDSDACREHGWPSRAEVQLDVRRADALVALASQAIVDDQDPDRATVVVHAELAALLADAGACEIEDGPVVHAETARRLCCDARLQAVLRDGTGNAVGIGRASRTVPRWLVRLLRHRDGGCTFRGCGARRFLYAHHIVHWVFGGPTDLDNLILVCHFHHKLLHEHGWQVHLDPRGSAVWLRPNGRRYDGSRAPPGVALARTA